MPDRENVIERLGRISYYFKSLRAVGWQGDADIYREHQESVNMAITLLQEQERARWILDRLHHYKYSACGTQWGRALNMNYCPTCGRYMEERDPDDWRYAQDTELPEEDTMDD